MQVHGPGFVNAAPVDVALLIADAFALVGLRQKHGDMIRKEKTSQSTQDIVFSARACFPSSNGCIWGRGSLLLSLSLSVLCLSASFSVSASPSLCLCLSLPLCLSLSFCLWLSIPLSLSFSFSPSLLLVPLSNKLDVTER